MDDGGVKSLLDEFANSANITKKEANAFLKSFQNVFVDALENDKVLKINGLGSFKLSLVGERNSVDVNTGKPIKINPHYKVVFTPETLLKNTVNAPFAHLETVIIEDVVDMSNGEVNIDTLPLNEGETSFDLKSSDGTQVEPEVDESEGIAASSDKIESPLEKLTEQALEIKSLLEDIQGTACFSDNATAAVSDATTAEVSDVADEVIPDNATAVVSEVVDASASDAADEVGQSDSVDVENEQYTEQNSVESTAPQDESSVSIKEEIPALTKEEHPLKEEPPTVPHDEPTVPHDEPTEPQEEPLPANKEKENKGLDNEMLSIIRDEYKKRRRVRIAVVLSSVFVVLMLTVALVLDFYFDGFVKKYYYSTFVDNKEMSEDLLTEGNNTLMENELLAVDDDEIEADENVCAGDVTDSVGVQADSVISDVVEVEKNSHVNDNSAGADSRMFSAIFNSPRVYSQYIDTIKMPQDSRLTLVSLKYYGHRDFWVYIYEANKSRISNPNVITPGTTLYIPKLDKALIDVSNPETIEYARYLHDIFVRK